MADTDSPVSQPERIIRITESISADAFDSWYREREFRRNILNGTAYFNQPGDIQPPQRHSPSRLLQCHRKTVYDQLHAPEESGDPDGIFWIGSKFEEELIVPFLQAIIGDDHYVTNSIWVDFTVGTDAGELRIKGETDPVVVTSDAEPILLTEIKTKETIDQTEEPNEHHRAQAHAYLKGLSEKYARTVNEAIIVYGSRKNLDIKTFHIEFDPWFWRETILKWAETHTTYRLDDQLPPATPRYGWECQFCPYSDRCGKSTSDYEDTVPTGLLPNYVEYPRQKLVTYLQAHEDAKLTPTLAHHHPDLARQYGVFEWRCPVCGATVAWDAVEWSGDPTAPPACPTCTDDPQAAFLRGPLPEEQPPTGEYGI